MKLKNKVAIVTGAARGIGKATALMLCKEGAKLVLSDILDLEDTRREILSSGGDIVSVNCDVTNSDAVSNLIQTTLNSFKRINILVNVAGVTTVSPVEKIEEKDWDLVMNVNAKGTFLTCRAVLPYMLKKKSGKIVNVSSDAGKTGYGGLAHYSASKFAIIGFTQALAREVGKHNINVNAVCPGIVYTPMWEKVAQSEYAKLIFPVIEKKAGLSAAEIVRAACEEANALGRCQSPEDLASMIVFLVSDEARNITGQSINVDSGQEFH